MKISLKKAAAIILASAGALASMNASADLVLPSTGNGELALFVRDTETGVVYVRGLSILLDDVLTQAASSGAYTGPTTISYALPTIGPDANMTEFLRGTTGHLIEWGVQGADTQGSNLPTTPRRVAMTSPQDLLLVPDNIPTTASLNSAAASINSFQTNTLANNLPDVPGSSVYGISDAGGAWGNPGTPGGALNILAGVANNSLFLGSVANFYMITTNGTTATGNGGVASRVFAALALQLDADGTLHSVAPTAPVPLPAAVWLLGSGLIGMAGIGRRRRNADSQVAAV